MEIARRIRMLRLARSLSPYVVAPMRNCKGRMLPRDASSGEDVLFESARCNHRISHSTFEGNSAHLPRCPEVAKGDGADVRIALPSRDRLVFILKEENCV